MQLSSSTLSIAELIRGRLNRHFFASAGLPLITSSRSTAGHCPPSHQAPISIISSGILSRVPRPPWVLGPLVDSQQRETIGQLQDCGIEKMGWP